MERFISSAAQANISNRIMQSAGAFIPPKDNERAAADGSSSTFRLYAVADWVTGADEEVPTVFPSMTVEFEFALVPLTSEYWPEFPFPSPFPLEVLFEFASPDAVPPELEPPPEFEPPEPDPLPPLEPPLLGSLTVLPSNVLFSPPMLSYRLLSGAITSGWLVGS